MDHGYQTVVGTIAVVLAKVIAAAAVAGIVVVVVGEVAVEVNDVE